MFGFHVHEYYLSNGVTVCRTCGAFPIINTYQTWTLAGTQTTTYGEVNR